MTWTAATGSVAGSIHNTGTFATNGGLTTHAAGNLMICIATCHNPTSGNEWCTGFTSTTPNVTGWTQATPTHNDTNTQLLIDTSNDVWGANIWFGTVSAVSTDSNISPTFSGPDNPPFYTNFVAMEFHSTLGSWSMEQWTFLQNNTGVTSWPTMTPAGPGELYLGFAWNSSSASSPATNPDTNGYHYNANADTTNNGMAYNLATPTGSPTGPVWADSSECWGVMVLVTEGSTGLLIDSVVQTPYPPPPPPPPSWNFSDIVGIPARYATSTTTPVAYATNQDVVAGGAGSWVNPGNADGPPDGSYATWVAP